MHSISRHSWTSLRGLNRAVMTDVETCNLCKDTMKHTTVRAFMLSLLSLALSGVISAAGARTQGIYGLIDDTDSGSHAVDSSAANAHKGEGSGKAKGKRRGKLFGFGKCKGKGDCADQTPEQKAAWEKKKADRKLKWDLLTPEEKQQKKEKIKEARKKHGPRPA